MKFSHAYVKMLMNTCMFEGRTDFGDSTLFIGSKTGPSTMIAKYRDSDSREGVSDVWFFTHLKVNKHGNIVYVVMLN